MQIKELFLKDKEKHMFLSKNNKKEYVFINIQEELIMKTEKRVMKNRRISLRLWTALSFSMNRTHFGTVDKQETRG